MTEHFPLSTHKRPLTRRRVLGASALGDWVSAIPTAPTRPGTRSLTTGSYRGNNHSYIFNVPNSAWKTDITQYNVLKLDIVSGSGGSAHLSAGTSFDCMDLLA